MQRPLAQDFLSFTSEVDYAEAKELTDRESSLGQASVRSQAKPAGGLTPKEERFARIRDQNERLGKKISRVFSVNRTR